MVSLLASSCLHELASPEQTKNGAVLANLFLLFMVLLLKNDKEEKKVDSRQFNI